MSQKDVSISWFREILSAEGYTVSDADSADAFFAKHPSEPTLHVDYRSSINLVIFTTTWNLTKPPSMLQKREFLDTVRRLNDSTIVCRCYVGNQFGWFSTQFTMYVCLQLTTFDVLRVVQLFNNATGDIIRKPDLQKFA
jgi:hypothetical protein